MLCHRSSRRQNLRQRLARTRARGVKPCADLNSNRSCKTLRQPTCSPGKSRPENDRPSIKFTVRYLRGQQYSVTALTDSTGTIKEQYAYDAYGNLSIFDSSGTARTSSAEGNRYAYTGREYDDVLDLYHYRARMYDSIAGRFCSRDQIGYYDGMNLVQYGHGRPTIAVDYTGYEGVMTSDCGSTEITSTFGPTFVSGMPWSNGPADGGFAVTVPDIDMDCNCSPCCSDGKFYVSSISFSITMTIFIDVAKILEYNRTRTPPAPPLTLEGIYGHEQQHVMNMSFWWATEGSSQIGDALSGLGNGEFSPIISTEAGCEASCLDFKDALRSIVVTAYLSQTHTAPNPPPFPQPRVPSPPLGPSPMPPHPIPFVPGDDDVEVLY
ncbi:RHS repeat-associated core domain-containing protein [Planctomycetes bacterium TBK1r]|uniref:tRNA(Glu)-specific nuclease WapA n=1 Tax=Stieleria magnilauensis TaxID=2527963 RepID=A0ABX5XVV3_9BACT|nr:tRNA(Glu)-specific nuclease WapA precursor [Planctomycetes bacterium TBK1r]